MLWECMSGLQLSFLQVSEIPVNYNPLPEIPSSFWGSRKFDALPSDPFYRKKLCREIFDLNHTEICKIKTFHKFYETTCVCLFCGGHVHPYHERYCTGTH